MSTTQKKENSNSVAIVGISCQFPGAKNVNEFWKNLIQGNYSISKMPLDRFTPSLGEHPNGYFWGNIDQIEQFDSKFFDLSPKEAEQMSPQQRLSLSCAFEAMLDAGFLQNPALPTNGGVFIAASNSEYKNELTESSDLNSSIGQSQNGISAHISRFLNLSGPSLTLDSDRSSSLVALHMAISSLTVKDCEFAVVGGVNLIITDTLSGAFKKAGILAKDGKCKFGDASADGIVRSEGSAFVVIKPLSSAISDGDRIYATIEASSVEHVAQTTDDLMTPSLMTQKKLFASTCRKAKLTPNQVSFIEAHGTGTPLGDKTEIEAIASVYACNRQKPLLVGSVKSNIGHSETICGLAGLIKAALALHHNLLPKTLHVKSPISEFKDRQLKLITSNIPILSENTTYAAVSSFGLTGTLAHVILGSFSRKKQPLQSKNPLLKPVLVSTPYKELLEDQARLSLSLVTDENLDKLSYSSAHRSPHYQFRCAFFAKNAKQVYEELEKFINKEKSENFIVAATEKLQKIRIIFSGIDENFFARTTQILTLHKAFARSLIVQQDALASVGIKSLPEYFRTPAQFASLNLNEKMLLTLSACITLGEFYKTLSKEITFEGTQVGKLAAEFLNGNISINDVFQKCKNGNFTWEKQSIIQESASTQFLFNVLVSSCPKTYQKEENIFPGLPPVDGQAQDWIILLTTTLWVYELSGPPAVTQSEHFSLPPPILKKSKVWKNIISNTLSSSTQNIDTNQQSSRRLSQLANFRTANPDKELPALIAYLQTLIAEILNFSLQELPDLRSPFRDLGLNSLASIELSQTISKDLGLSISSSVLYNYPNIVALADYLIELKRKSGFRNIGQILIENQAIKIDEIQIALNDHNKNPNEKIGSILLRKGLVSKEDLEHALKIQKEDAIAIIGIACKAPGADSTDQFWNNLCEGKLTVKPLSDQRKSLYRGSPPQLTPSENGSYLNHIELFDPEFFGISPREASQMDPQQRILLLTTWQALENANIAARSLNGESVGVFVGMMNHNDYANLKLKPEFPEGINHFDSTCDAISIAGGRLSYFLNLKGPNVTIDTACSSSLVALHQACISLKSGESKLAIAGGVNVIATSVVTARYKEANMLSATNACHVFDQSADGYVRGEGCGIVILKKLSQAIVDQDNILAVIAGSAVTHGGRSSGLVAPNGLSQEKVITNALESAGLEPNQVGYIEAHGTGTRLGDPIEMGAIAKVFSKRQDTNVPLYVGSLKANIGHLEAAAGIMGLIKAAYAVNEGVIPQQINVNTINSEIQPLMSGINFPKFSQPWPKEYKSRVAGISSFGFSGTNAHVLIKQPPQLKIKNHIKNDMNPYLFTISAKTEEQLVELANCYSQMLTTDPSVCYSDICYSIARGRDHFSYRAASICRNINEIKFFLNNIKENIHVPSVNNTMLTLGLLPNQSVKIYYNLSEETKLTSFIQSVLSPQPESAMERISSEYTKAYLNAQYLLKLQIKIESIIGDAVTILAAFCAHGLISTENALSSLRSMNLKNNLDRLPIIKLSLDKDKIANLNLTTTGSDTLENILSKLTEHELKNCYLLSEQNPSPINVIKNRSDFLDLVRKLYLSGANTALENLFLSENHNLIQLPNYPFKLNQYWISLASAEKYKKSA